jgi:NAD(P)H-flavin reductase
MWLSLEAADGLPAAFEPGHVLGLGLQQDHGLMRHAYTVSRGEPSLRRFEHLFRLIPNGRMTPLLAAQNTGDTVYFHGPFHTPIQREIQRDAERIVLVATGTGVGPVFGYAEKVLREGETRPISLYTGFREVSDICLSEELDELSRRCPNLSWEFSLTRPPRGWMGLEGRVTECVPEQLDLNDLHSSHFHLVGNGDMVHLMRKALVRAGVSPGRVSIETYFNHHAEPPELEIDLLVDRLLTRGTSGSRRRNFESGRR